MPRRTTRLPAPRLHKPSGQAYVRLGGKFHYLGKFGSAEARQKYERLLAEWLSRDRTPSPPSPRGASVAEVLAAFWHHAVSYYRSADGESTGEAENFKEALKPVRRLYQDLPAADFGIEQLKAVRAEMIRADLARSTINARVNKIRRVWRWAASEGMVPASVYLALKALDSLLKGRTQARESRGIGRVRQDQVEATLPHMPAPVAAMVRLQLLTGCRAGEVLALRGADIDRLKDPWEYVPSRHKNSWREGQAARIVHLGPKAQEIVRRFLRDDDQAYLFDPREVVAENRRAGRGGRPVRMTAPRYDRRTYAQAIMRACDKAFAHPTLSSIPRRKLTPAQKSELGAWRKVHRWTPLQLRHAAATRVREQFGLEAAQAVLGHAKADVTQLYAEKLMDKAKDVARATG